ncbi:uncharacterized protein LOC119114339 isoform X2 [Pollicipes pollicipes]|uniref:uncharacterized protein LOC119114339 isoform X2 n=1 Tax=Pollicipes pollicipes TaxID=41117 RepID=UPI001884DAD2|nr:uncharacterized protein LOC119114339 isoform X2 [Pollicipes pollicipes]XP_037094435.1 uncharacterized protein LOC119114339 isoform X2 [Pollicipes pollicipes]XP_037094436.1 uncharacterized protein LOC119114339 isoform X2 [Pollicipes pollicipes]
MSVSHPLLKELKNYVLILTKDAQTHNEVLDDHPSMVPFCQVLERIFREGLVGPVYTPFGITKRDYWSVVESVYQERISVSSSFHHSVEAVQKSQRVHTQQGRGRLFLRCALFKRCLHVPYRVPDPVREEPGRVRPGRLCDGSRDPGRDLPLTAPPGVAAQVPDKVESGDIVDELYGECCYGMRRGRVSSLLKLYQGMPVYISVVKCHSVTGDLYPPVIPLLEHLRLDLAQLTATYQAKAQQQRRQAESAAAAPERADAAEPDPGPAAQYVAGTPVHYMGAGFVGNRGDVTVIEIGVENVLRNQPEPHKVQLVLGETGITLVDRATGEVVRKHCYTEIASCGRRNDRLRHFAYVAGETSCNLARFFYCHVFEAVDEEQARTVLHGIAEGFRRTHFAV